MARYNEITGLIELKLGTKRWKSEWTVMPSNSSGQIPRQSVTFPTSWVGKKVRLRIEEVKGTENSSEIVADFVAEKGQKGQPKSL